MTVIENPIINSPFREPTQHHELDARGNPTGQLLSGRRKSSYLTPIPQARKQSRLQQPLFEEVAPKEQENSLINQIRLQVSRWRGRGYPHITRTTRQLLEYWTAPNREKPLFFCQIEALETVIYITEVAKRDKGDWIEDELRNASEEANPGLYRMALKMATGSGKTVVMAMLIAWQALNKINNPGDARFSSAFLLIAPGVTIRDRLRVLNPENSDNYYTKRDIIPESMRASLFRAKIHIINYHQFMPRELVDAATLTKRILIQNGQPNPFTESPGQVVQRICRPLGESKNIIVINDEAHHCYDRKLTETNDLKGDLAREVEERRVWANGIREIQNKLGVRVVYDLSATPFFLGGSGYPEGKLFPWVVSDFALIDAIESGIVKIPRLPVMDDSMVGELPKYRNLWVNIKDALPKKAGKQKENPAQNKLPDLLEGALYSLYSSYKRYHDMWSENEQRLARGEAAHGALPPPVMIVVCNNTRVSKLVYDWISGYERELSDGTSVMVSGNLELFRNAEGDRWLPRPTTILVDSEQLEKGTGMTDDFKKIASREIASFKSELRQMGKDEDFSDAELLREVMNTVGKAGKLGESVKCVVSVSMLTEGWDVNTVTHILGVRAFSTQLICEQVVGRALRRTSYVVNEQGMFEQEYAEVYGVPFSFMPTSGTNAKPKLGRNPTQVKALPERANASFRFPNVIGYRYELNDQPLETNFSKDSYFTISSAQVPTKTEIAPLVGKSEIHELDDLARHREKEVAFWLAKHLLEQYFSDDYTSAETSDNHKVEKVWYFPQLLAIAQHWMSHYLDLRDGCTPQMLLIRSIGQRAAEKIHRAIILGTSNEQLKLIVDPAAPIGSSDTVDFETTREVYRTHPKKCQVNYIPLDSGWEANMAFTLENMPEVLSYVKNAGLNMRIPYTHDGNEHHYIPDFLVRVDMGNAQPLNLIVEVSGQRDEKKTTKADTLRTLWLPAVNALGTFGRWDSIEITDPTDTQNSIRRQLKLMERN